MKTINDLKEYLEEILSDLENNYDGDEKLRIVGNTYFCGSNFLSCGSRGFIDFDNPADYEEDEE